MQQTQRAVFTRIRFFMLDAHSLLITLISSAFSSKTSSPQLDAAFNQDIWLDKFNSLQEKYRKQAHNGLITPHLIINSKKIAALD